jgi:hypothetical protein
MDNTIFDNANDGKSNTAKGKITLKNLSPKQKELLMNGTIGLAGIAAGLGVFSLMSFADKVENPTPVNPEPNPVPETDINSNHELVTIFTEAPFAQNVNDNMSFGQAFTTARTEVGQGGFFEWKGDLYNTYTKEEWSQLNPEQQNQYWASIDDNISSIHEGEINTIDDEITLEPITENENNNDDLVILDSDDNNINTNENNTDQVVVNDTNNTIEISEADFIEGVDVDGNGVADAYLVDANGNQLPDLVIDSDLNGDLNQIILDINEQGITGNEVVIDINPINTSNIEDVPMATINNEENNITGQENEIVALNDNEADILSDEELNPDSFDPNADMSDYV